MKDKKWWGSDKLYIFLALVRESVLWAAFKKKRFFSGTLCFRAHTRELSLVSAHICQSFHWDDQPSLNRLNKCDLDNNPWKY